MADPKAPAKPVTTAAAPKYELRQIVLAQGIQFNNKDEDPDDRVPEGYLTKQLGSKIQFSAGPKGSGGFWYFRSEKQGVLYTLIVVNEKDVFKIALEGHKFLHVIYDGHSRYGRGACFGAKDDPGEDWETGTTPAKTGLYRMGFEYVGVPVDDLDHHKYTLDVVPTSESLAPSRCEPDLRSFVKAKALKHLKLKSIPSHLQSFLRINKGAVGAADRFWGFNWPGEGLTVVTHAGWTATASDPMDLGATNLGCRVFCHFGCSSFQHYQHIVRERKNWKKVGNTDQFAYFTSNIAFSVTTSFWLYHLFTYDKFNAFQPWEPSLEYARAKANVDLRAWCKDHHESIYSIQ